MAACASFQIFPVDTMNRQKGNMQQAKLMLLFFDKNIIRYRVISVFISLSGLRVGLIKNSQRQKNNLTVRILN